MEQSVDGMDGLDGGMVVLPLEVHKGPLLEWKEFVEDTASSIWVPWYSSIWRIPCGITYWLLSDYQKQPFLMAQVMVLPIMNDYAHRRPI